MMLMGISMVVYFIAFYIMYDNNGFWLSSIGKRRVRYQYHEVQTQQLYLLTGGSTLIELHMADGRAVSIQSTMQGAYQFLNYAFKQWCNQSGKEPTDCGFYNPANSCWFPNEER